MTSKDQRCTHWSKWRLWLWNQSLLSSKTRLEWRWPLYRSVWRRSAPRSRRPALQGEWKTNELKVDRRERATARVERVTLEILLTLTSPKESKLFLAWSMKTNVARLAPKETVARRAMNKVRGRFPVRALSMGWKTKCRIQRGWKFDETKIWCLI